MEQDFAVSEKIERIGVRVFRVPVTSPVVTSFGAMRSRPAVFVRIEDSEGAFGWGEIFANWPAAGAEHRARLLVEDIGDLVFQNVFTSRTALFESLTRTTHIRALQCGEWGPFSAVIAGLDIAFHDLLARKANVQIAHFLNAEFRSAVPTYASGIHIGGARAAIDRCRSLGYNAFKVKVGFDMASDISQTTRAAGMLEPGERLFADANQAWNAESAAVFLSGVKEIPIGWIEEPIPADAPAADWLHLAQSTRIPIAGGENISGSRSFREAMASGVFGVIQPDIAKWGGFSGCFPVAREAIEKGLLYCPHFLGGGIGLAASASLLAAAGGKGLLEVDANANPLREAFGLWPKDGTRHSFPISEQPGLGIVELPAELTAFETLTATITSSGLRSVTSHN